MNRSALKPIVTTALMAIVAVLLWQFWIADPCLGTHIANHWTEKNPPAIAATPTPTPAAGSTDYVVIENPYGITTCDHWPTPAGEVLSTSVFAIVAFAIGWLTARRVPHRPLFVAAAIASLAMLIALSLEYWAQWKSVEFFHSPLEILAMLLSLVVASGTAMLGAWSRIRFSRRP